MKILMACGGSGGHIFPAFSVAEELKLRQPDVQIVYACGKKDIESAIFKIVQGQKVVQLEGASSVGKGALYPLVFLLKLLKGFTQSIRLINNEKPDAVVGFGGYLSFPVVLAAKVLGKKTIVHEQNVIPGIANKLLAGWVDGVALSFPETGDYLSSNKKLKVTGNPIRSSIERDCRAEALDFFGFSEGKKTLLVLGGSQGAESVNTLFLNSLKFIPESVKKNIQVVHLCGKMPLETAKKFFQENGVDARVYSFFERMELAYGATDLALGRAGATFLAEIAAKAIPAILIPYPYANGHQLLNAQVFSKYRQAVVLEQKSLKEEKLAQVLEEKLKDVSGKVQAPGKTHDSNSRVRFADFILEKAAS